ncbi:DoxX family protein [Streptomyces xinghaiensis]|uniref:DoxX family protein n=1 Tax=Streptomyces xinghaiensis TaxID=1038928 RepID=UPI003C2B5BCE
MSESRVSPARVAPGERGLTGALNRSSGHVLGLFRIVVGFLFACHGAVTLFNVLGGPHGGVVPEVGAWPSWWAAAIQLVGGGLVMLGVWTRIAATLCSGSMAYAYFVSHQGEALFPLQNGGEAAAMFCWAFLLIAVLGPGRLALDSLFRPADERERETDGRNALAV